MNKNEAFSRVVIDAQLAALRWNVQDPNSVCCEVVLDDGTPADYVLCDRAGRAMPPRRPSITPSFWEWETEAFLHIFGRTNLPSNQ